MRARITFTKQGALRYTGHLDLHRLWERAMRRADLPLSYSQGFHPQPKISIAAALPLGFSSRAEVVDVRFNEEISTEEIASRLKDNLPVDKSDLTRKVGELMMSESLPRERRGKSYDLRPLIETLNVDTEADGKVSLRMTLSARDGATGRPEEVLNMLDIEPEYTSVERTRLIFEE